MFTRVVNLLTFKWLFSRVRRGKGRRRDLPVAGPALDFGLVPGPQLLPSDLCLLSSVFCHLVLRPLSVSQDTNPGHFRRRWEPLARFWASLFWVPNRDNTQCLPAFRWLDFPNRTRRAIAERRGKSKIQNQKSQGRVSFWTRQLFLKKFFKEYFPNLVPCRAEALAKAGPRIKKFCLHGKTENSEYF